ncbi:hypothetical protein BC793_15615 [Actinoplanes xinjiangensis]|uniref:Uncharacterized protein n=1 Tax=Actinoplanes xinjiangensis TaxID=512350 RepID=A0A316E902_9ACTN|nr:hypothetical protein BC793_15615 [Actinoplanes xinjiangensis]GIF45265.1 hypothetical protein Axi01nite_95760 [Actinoplanes xinjiangensis]
MPWRRSRSGAAVLELSNAYCRHHAWPFCQGQAVGGSGGVVQSPVNLGPAEIDAVSALTRFSGAPGEVNAEIGTSWQ